jgi:hypothetical protein
MLDFKDALDFPLYLRMFDVPGNAIAHVKDEESIFKNLDYVFITLDGSKVIHRDHILVLNTYIIQRLRTYNEKVIKKENTDYKYKEYLFRLMGDTPEDSGNVIKEDEVQDKPLHDHQPHDDEEEDEKHAESLHDNSHLEASHNMNSEVNNMNSQYTIMNHRNDTYKNITPRDNADEEPKDNLDQILNIYKKKSKTTVANFPAIFHIITKCDMLSEAGLEDQMNRAKVLEGDLIDKFFFVSSRDNSGVDDFLKGLNDRRIEQMVEDQEERDSMRHMSQPSQRD